MNHCGFSHARRATPYLQPPAGQQYYDVQPHSGVKRAREDDGDENRLHPPHRRRTQLWKQLGQLELVCEVYALI